MSVDFAIYLVSVFVTVFGVFAVNAVVPYGMLVFFKKIMRL
jgi:hypothetical protein